MPNGYGTINPLMCLGNGGTCASDSRVRFRYSFVATDTALAEVANYGAVLGAGVGAATLNTLFMPTAFTSLPSSAG